MGMKSGITYMLVGAGLGAGAFMAYQQFQNGNVQNALKKLTKKSQTQSQTQNKLGNMM